MNLRNYSIIFGAIVGILGLFGLLAGEGVVADGALNIEWFLDLVRLAFGAWLILAGTQSEAASKSALSTFGITYIGMFIFGLISPTLFGLVPSGLGLMDQTLHLVGGALALMLSMRRSTAARIAGR